MPGTPEIKPSARILVVDDNPANTKLLARILAGAGYTQVKVTNDPRAVGALRGESHAPSRAVG
jgi:CheY-like chemotaxis protein